MVLHSRTCIQKSTSFLVWSGGLLTRLTSLVGRTVLALKFLIPPLLLLLLSRVRGQGFCVRVLRAQAWRRRCIRGSKGVWGRRLLGCEGGEEAFPKGRWRTLFAAVGGRLVLFCAFGGSVRELYTLL
jgi:hypothetical protein